MSTKRRSAFAVYAENKPTDSEVILFLFNPNSI